MILRQNFVQLFEKAAETTDTHIPAQEVIEAELENQAVKEMSAISKYLSGHMSQIAINLLIALIIAILGHYVIKLLIRLISKAFNASAIDKGFVHFFISAIKFALRIILLLLIGMALGFKMTSLLALIASSGLAIGLGFQGAIANFAGGFLIMLTKPFSVGDYIQYSGDHEGKVISIDIIYTRIRTIDNEYVIIPNGTLANSVITNYTKDPNRIIRIHVHISYNADIDHVKSVLYEVAVHNHDIDSERGVTVAVDQFDQSSIVMLLKVWGPADKKNNDRVRWELQEEVKRQFAANHIVIPYNQLDIHLNQ